MGFMERMMTLPISARSGPDAPGPGAGVVLRRDAGDMRKRSAFTMVELLTVIGIIALIIGIAAPMLVRSLTQAKRLRAASDLQAIASALEAYRQDFGDYPRIGAYPGGLTGTPTGAEVLCWALIAPASASLDGLDGPGFRVRLDAGGQPTGRKFGPYLQTESFRIGDPGYPGDVRYPDNPIVSGPSLVPQKLVLLDTFNRPVLYFPGNAAAKNFANPDSYIKVSSPSAAVLSRYDAYDNAIYLRRGSESDDSQAVMRIAAMLGDTNADGAIDTASGERAITAEPYLLWSAGPDGLFGTASGTPDNAELQKADDVTNFNLEQ